VTEPDLPHDNILKVLKVLRRGLYITPNPSPGNTDDELRRFYAINEIIA